MTVISSKIVSFKRCALERQPLTIDAYDNPSTITTMTVNFSNKYRGSGTNPGNREMLRMFTILILFAPLMTQAQREAQFSYEGRNLQNLSVPIGGIGTGNILMGGRGNIDHIEVFNRPDRQRVPINTFFAIHAKEEGKPAVTKLLEREYLPPYPHHSHLQSAGLPRLKEAVFTNNFPLANWQFIDPDVPLEIMLEVFNPFTPLDVDNSSFPVVSYNWKFRNTNSTPVSASVLLSVENPIKADKITNAYFQQDGLTGIRFSPEQGADTNYQGAFLAVVKSEQATVQTHLYPGEWRDDMHVLWSDFSSDGVISPNHETWISQYKPPGYNENSNRNSVILVQIDLSPGQEITIPFYMAWYFPDRTFGSGETFGTAAAGKVFSNYYKKLFADESEALNKFIEQQDELRSQTKAFSEALQNSSFPAYVIEALTTQAASIRTNLMQVTEEGNVHGFEGVLSTGWCCPGTCTHVWNYEQALASLFPELERNMREIEFLYNVEADGLQQHRSVFPLGYASFDGGAAADGQMGSITRVYREWMFSGDNAWLSKMWPKVKLALEYAWKTHWDPDKDGILDGRQHNTYDISFFGPSSMTTSCYLAALKACSLMAKAMGENGKAKEYSIVYQSGVKKMEELLWNGQYFIQIIPEDPQNKFTEGMELSPPDKDGRQLPKYQYGDGCLADQLLGQYIAQNAGLGYIVDPGKTKMALKAIYDNNFIKQMRHYDNLQRVYAVNEEAGVVLCAWPRDNQPLLPFVYAQEIWSGVEFALAASMIRTGMVAEGLEIVKAVQDRHDGFKRNPFMHNESGVHYARAMSSWSLLLALSGFEYDGVGKSMAFSPVLGSSDFSSFWSTGHAWGTFIIEQGKATLKVQYGDLTLKTFSLAGTNFGKNSAYNTGRTRTGHAEARFKKPLQLGAGQQFVFELAPGD